MDMRNAPLLELRTFQHLRHGRIHHLSIPCGEVAEWLKAAASKAVVPVSGTVGSNPTLSASSLYRIR